MVFDLRLPRRTRLVLGTLALLFLGLLSACRSSAPPGAPASGNSVVARIAGQPIRSASFRSEYRQLTGEGQAAVAESLETPQARLDQYVNYKLKIRAAQDAGYDDRPDIQQKISAYRRQVARPLLLRREVLEPITRTLYERGRREIDVSHILLRLPPDAPPADTLKAYRTLETLADSARHGADFGALARRHSQSPAARREGRPGYEGHLGYLSAGRLVAPFEDVMYATAVESVSEPFRTRFGYHILKVHDRRPTPPDVRVSHLMVQASQRAGEAARDSARRQAEQYRARILDGEDFAALARRHSDHAPSAQKGGDLGFLSHDARMIPALHDAAFALDSVGAVSGVIETRFGYHLLKLTDRRTPPSYADAYEALKKQAARLPRTQKAERRLAAEVRRRLESRVDTAAVRGALRDSTGPGSGPLILAGRPVRKEAAGRSFATLGDSTYTVGALARFVQQKRGAPRTLDPAIDAFLNEKAVDYEAALRVQQDDTLRQQVQRYRDGLLIFQLMQDSVWSAATQDNDALRAYYRAHRSRYRAPERAEVFALHSDALAPLRAVAARLQSGAALGDALASYAGGRVDTTRVPTAPAAGTTGDAYGALAPLQPGDYRGPLAHGDGFRLLVRGATLPAGPQPFAQARTAVMRDHQQAAEQAFLQRLRQRYDVETYPDRLSPPQQTATAPATSGTGR